MSDDKNIQFVSVLRKYPTYRDDAVKSSIKWLAGKREDDNAEGLWRVHDKLYNLNSFIDKHPGGREWLEFTEVRNLKSYVFIVTELKQNREPM